MENPENLSFLGFINEEIKFSKLLNTRRSSTEEKNLKPPKYYRLIDNQLVDFPLVFSWDQDKEGTQLIQKKLGQIYESTENFRNMIDLKQLLASNIFMTNKELFWTELTNYSKKQKIYTKSLRYCPLLHLFINERSLKTSRDNTIYSFLENLELNSHLREDDPEQESKQEQLENVNLFLKEVILISFSMSEIIDFYEQNLLSSGQNNNLHSLKIKILKDQTQLYEILSSQELFLHFESSLNYIWNCFKYLTSVCGVESSQLVIRVPQLIFNIEKKRYTAFLKTYLNKVFTFENINNENFNKDDIKFKRDLAEEKIESLKIKQTSKNKLAFKKQKIELKQNSMEVEELNPSSERISGVVEQRSLFNYSNQNRDASDASDQSKKKGEEFQREISKLIEGQYQGGDALNAQNQHGPQKDIYNQQKMIPSVPLVTSDSSDQINESIQQSHLSKPEVLMKQQISGGILMDKVNLKTLLIQILSEEQIINQNFTQSDEENHQALSEQGKLKEVDQRIANFSNFQQNQVNSEVKQIINQTNSQNQTTIPSESFRQRIFDNRQNKEVQTQMINDYEKADQSKNQLPKREKNIKEKDTQTEFYQNFNQNIEKYPREIQMRNPYWENNNNQYQSNNNQTVSQQQNLQQNHFQNGWQSQNFQSANRDYPQNANMYQGNFQQDFHINKKFEPINLQYQNNNQSSLQPQYTNNQDQNQYFQNRQFANRPEFNQQEVYHNHKDQQYHGMCQCCKYMEKTGHKIGNGQQNPQDDIPRKSQTINRGISISKNESPEVQYRQPPQRLSPRQYQENSRDSRPEMNEESSKQFPRIIPSSKLSQVQVQKQNQSSGHFNDQSHQNAINFFELNSQSSDQLDDQGAKKQGSYKRYFKYAQYNLIPSLNNQTPQQQHSRRRQIQQVSYKNYFQKIEQDYQSISRISFRNEQINDNQNPNNNRNFFSQEMNFFQQNQLKVQQQNYQFDAGERNRAQEYQLNEQSMLKNDKNRINNQMETLSVDRNSSNYPFLESDPKLKSRNQDNFQKIDNQERLFSSSFDSFSRDEDDRQFISNSEDQSKIFKVGTGSQQQEDRRDENQGTEEQDLEEQSFSSPKFSQCEKNSKYELSSIFDTEKQLDQNLDEQSLKNQETENNIQKFSIANNGQDDYQANYVRQFQSERKISETIFYQRPQISNNAHEGKIPTIIEKQESSNSNQNQASQELRQQNKSYSFGRESGTQKMELEFNPDEPLQASQDQQNIQQQKQEQLQTGQGINKSPTYSYKRMTKNLFNLQNPDADWKSQFCVDGELVEHSEDNYDCGSLEDSENSDQGEKGEEMTETRVLYQKLIEENFDYIKFNNEKNPQLLNLNDIITKKLREIQQMLSKTNLENYF